MIAAVLFAALLAQTDTPWYDPSQAMCYISLSNAPADAPRFEDYPAEVHRLKKRTPVQMTTRLARRFRTVLRDAASREPDFAGDFIVGQWGCGARCAQWAVINPKTGHVATQKDYQVVVGNNIDDADMLSYRRDSRLIVVEGSADDENSSHDGLTYFAFDGKAFRKIAYYSTREYCVPMYHGPR